MKYRRFNAFRIAVAAVLMAAHSAQAGTVVYELQLFGNSSPNVEVGEGYFAVDSAAVRLSGSVDVVASDLVATFGSTTFSYASGNTFIVGSPPAPPVLVEDPHSDATVRFVDGVPTSIQYSELHICQYTYHCPPAAGLQLNGTNFIAQLSDFQSFVGTIGFAAAVPEPSSGAMLLVGLALVCLTSSRSLRQRLP